MVAEASERRSGRLVGAVALALLLAGLTLLLEPASRRGAAAAVLVVGLAAGVVAALRLPGPGRRRSAMERLNDAAFLVVVAAVALIAVRLARPWTAALPGLVGGALIGLALRPPPPAEPPPPPPGPSSGPPSAAGPDAGLPPTAGPTPTPGPPPDAGSGPGPGRGLA
jgi:hypothetical protein